MGGKSTLVKILAGIYQPDSGELSSAEATGRAHTPKRPARGIYLVPQEPSLMATLSSRRIFQGILRRKPVPLLTRLVVHAPRGAEHLSRVGLDIDPAVLSES